MHFLWTNTFTWKAGATWWGLAAGWRAGICAVQLDGVIKHSSPRLKAWFFLCAPMCGCVCLCLEVLERSWEESCKCPPPQQGQRWEPLTSAGTDCQGQLVGPVFIYLFLNKGQVVTLWKGHTNMSARTLVYRQYTHTHIRIVSLPPWLTHAYCYHPLNVWRSHSFDFQEIWDNISKDI